MQLSLFVEVRVLKKMLHNVNIHYKPCEDGETLLRVTAQVTMIQTARAIFEGCRGGGAGQGDGWG